MRLLPGSQTLTGIDKCFCALPLMLVCVAYVDSTQAAVDTALEDALIAGLCGLAFAGAYFSSRWLTHQLVSKMLKKH